MSNVVCARCGRVPPTKGALCDNCDCEVCSEIALPRYPLPQPPLGIMPKSIHEMKRIQELSEAINRYTHYYNDGAQNALILDWVYELKNMLESNKGISEEVKKDLNNQF